MSSGRGLIIYSRQGFSDISDLFYDCIEHSGYKNVPGNIKANTMQINSFEITLNGHLYFCANDPSDIKICN